jgi:hypothetical protein
MAVLAVLPALDMAYQQRNYRHYEHCRYFRMIPSAGFHAVAVAWRGDLWSAPQLFFRRAFLPPDRFLALILPAGMAFPEAALHSKFHFETRTLGPLCRGPLPQENSRLLESLAVQSLVIPHVPPSRIFGFFLLLPLVTTYLIDIYLCEKNRNNVKIMLNVIVPCQTADFRKLL